MSQLNKALSINEQEFLEWVKLSEEEFKKKVKDHFSPACRYVALSSIAAEQDRLKEEKRRLADERKIAAANKKVEIAARKEAKEKEKALTAGMTPAQLKEYKDHKKLQKQLDKQNEPKLDI